MTASLAGRRTWLLTDLFAGFVAYLGLLDLPLPGPEQIVQVLSHGFTSA